MTSVEVAVEPSYSVLVGADLLAGLGSRIGEERVALVSDSNVLPLHGRRLQRTLEDAGKSVTLVEVPAGETSKTLPVLSEVLRSLAQAGLRRDSAVVALGGGVVTDLAGFAAASYLRGIAFYSCPTSLLAMVDASVGGKTGVNLPEGKNLVGAFWQPRAVIADVNVLASLPDRQFRDGAVELFKHGFLGDPCLLGALEDVQFNPDGDPARLEEYVARSVMLKARVVAGDEREAGARAQLNLGHTLGHALEGASGHEISHGEAVAYGLLFAALLGRGRGWYDFVDQARRLLAWLEPRPLPVRDFDELVPYVLRDKKNSARRQRWVLLDPAGEAAIVDDVDDAEQRRAWGQLLELLP